ncbi:MAG: hypothetical protein EA381_11305 [Planctomycetaceae bacterium]|nr:MAG: hypothetical protein EA381_11305 [Planctomycetaceae bacterium]
MRSAADLLAGFSSRIDHRPGSIGRIGGETGEASAVARTPHPCGGFRQISLAVAWRAELPVIGKRNQHD